MFWKILYKRQEAIQLAKLVMKKLEGEFNQMNLMLHLHAFFHVTSFALVLDSVYMHFKFLPGHWRHTGKWQQVIWRQWSFFFCLHAFFHPSSPREKFPILIVKLLTWRLGSFHTEKGANCRFVAKKNWPCPGFILLEMTSYVQSTKSRSNQKFSETKPRSAKSINMSANVSITTTAVNGMEHCWLYR